MKAILLSIVVGLCTCFAFAAETRAAVVASQENSARLLRWYQSRTVSAYQKTSGTNEAWDQHAIQALGLFARLSSDPQQRSRTNYRALHLSLSNAVEAGCNDPLIRYLNLLHGPAEPSAPPEETIENLERVARKLQKTKYATPLKFDAQFRPWIAWHEQHGRYHTNPHPRTLETCVDESFKLAWKTAQETSTPIEVVFGVMEQMMDAYEKSETSQKAFYEAVQKDLMKNWPKSAYVHLFRGSFYVDHAWHARGQGGVATVSPENWKLFNGRLAIAEESLETAWQLDPTLERIPIEMLRVELGQGRGRARMEQWFQRAMALNPNNDAVCRAKLNYLLPQWHGSARDMLEFGRECVASTNWGGVVPWILVRAHELLETYTYDEQLKKAYWKNPMVWPDLKLASERYLKTCPYGTNAAHQSFILNARRCEQWDEVSKHLRLLTHTNYDFFGGREAFETMARTAAEKSGRPK